MESSKNKGKIVTISLCAVLVAFVAAFGFSLSTDKGTYSLEGSVAYQDSSVEAACSADYPGGTWATQVAFNVYSCESASTSGCVPSKVEYIFCYACAGQKLGQNCVNALRSKSANGWYHSSEGLLNPSETFSVDDLVQRNYPEADIYSVLVVGGATSGSQKVEAPSPSYCINNLTYNGNVQTITNSAGVGYTFSGNQQSTVGTHTVTATLQGGYVWSNGSSSPVTFDCNISKGNPTVTITPPSGTVAVGSTTTFKVKANVSGNYKFTANDKVSVLPTTGNANANTDIELTVTGSADGLGTVTIDFIPNESAGYNSVSSRYEVTVGEGGGSATPAIVAVTKPTSATACKPASQLQFTGSDITLTVEPGTGYTFKDNTAKDLGPHKVTASLTDITKYKWNDNTISDFQFDCTIVDGTKSATIPNSSYCIDNLVHTGNVLTLTKKPPTGVKFINNTATEVGAHEVTAKLDSGYKWSDGTTEDVKFSCSIVSSNGGTDSGGNVTDNPQTGNIAMVAVWVIGLGAVFYSLWYFRKLNLNN